MEARLLLVVILLVGPAAAEERVRRSGVLTPGGGREFGAPGDGSRVGGIWGRP
jgi:hypothetical protein